MRVLLCGACFAGNRGGEAMYETFIEQIGRYDASTQIVVLTKYPKDEIPICQKRGYEVHTFTTINRIFIGLPFWLLGSLLKVFHLPHMWMACETIKQYYNCDILVDFSGISFSDFRGFLDLIINSTWFFPAFVSGIPIIKMSQSLGPYNKITNRIIAKYCLKRMNTVIARGESSYRTTKELLNNQTDIYNLPDVAMCLSPANDNICDSILEKLGLKGKKFIVMAPSVVVNGRYGAEKYQQLYEKIVKTVVSISGLPIVFIPHTRHLSEAVAVDSASDDITVCRAIMARSALKDVDIRLIEKEYNCRELKAVIARAEYAIGSRYHFLIGAMSSGIPSIALGWGYKYEEMFELFDMKEFAFECNTFDEKVILKKVKNLAASYEVLGQKIKQRLPEIKAKSEKNVQLAIKLLKME